MRAELAQILHGFWGHLIAEGIEETPNKEKLTHSGTGYQFQYRREVVHNLVSADVEVQLRHSRDKFTVTVGESRFIFAPRGENPFPRPAKYSYGYNDYRIGLKGEKAIFKNSDGWTPQDIVRLLIDIMDRGILAVHEHNQTELTYETLGLEDDESSPGFLCLWTDAPGEIGAQIQRRFFENNRSNVRYVKEIHPDLEDEFGHISDLLDAGILS